ncbi:NADH dehydrogenase (ubiquinone) complex I, assembly factor 6-like [Pollicipes pollicipes]|uniref:NADH dehydrogenase (ubiquinone) complex I, assembly factor 6-like n=1 Tax=Pollicipes pollicipes TaxID=41117 RepID=UPI0018855BD0|nr:NADH dehydrogenase (ubiquinone) complex I, assembly factor 6-like [Pollicipes pollicipes]
MSAPMLSTGIVRQTLRSGRQNVDNFRLARNGNPLPAERGPDFVFPRRSTSSYCLELVRKHDYENFLCTLLLPNQARAGVFAIRAFNVELARVRDTVSESQIGLMRLQFWSDAIDKTFRDDPPQQPVALELHRATKNPPDLQGMAEAAGGNLGLAVGSEQLQLASRLGRVQGVTSLLRRRLWRGRDQPGLREVTFEVASVAHRHLEHVKEHFAELPVAARSVFLPGVAVASYLRRLQRADFDVFHPALQRRDGWLPARLWWARLRRTM